MAHPFNQITEKEVSKKEITIKTERKNNV